MNITLERAVIEQALEAMEYADACLKRQLTTKTKHEYAQDLLLDSGTALRTALGHQYMTNAAGELEPVTIVQTGVGIGKSEQKPVAWMYINTDGECEQIEYIEFQAMPDDPSITPLYDAPPQRKPLSDEEIQAIWKKTFESGSSPNTFARAIEAAHGIKD